MKHLLVALVLLGVAGWFGMSHAAHTPDHSAGVQVGPTLDQDADAKAFRERRRAAVRAGYRSRYVKCRRLLGLKPRPHRGSYRDMRRCWASHRRVAEWPWGKLAGCETGRRWHYNGRTGESRSYWSPPSGFDGGLQFHPRTWSAYRPQGYPRRAHLASPKMQVRVAKRVLRAQGKRAWPVCSRRIGWR